MAYVTITAGQTDHSSPVDVLLMSTLRTNQDYLEARVVTNGDSHDHSGGDGAPISQASIAASAVGQGELKTSIGEVSTVITGGVNLTLPGGGFGFYPQVKSTGPGVTAQISKVITTTSFLTYINLNLASAGTATARQIYVIASPPYKIGGEEWGHFLYMLVNAQGDVVASYEAEDPPYAYNGPDHHGKDSAERIQAVPHPFADYFDKDPSVDGLEIVLVDLRGYDTKKWKEDNLKQGKGILEDLGNINKGGQIVTPQSLGIENIQGFTDRVKIRKHN